MKYKDYYAALGVPRDADADQIKKAYRKLARAHHPDVSAAPGSGIASGNESGFGVSYGIGAEYVFSPQLSAVLQYDEHRLKFAGTGRDRVSATSVGLRYRF
jgi:opacity protein-like surface antigen